MKNESFYPFRAASPKVYIYRQYTRIFYILQYYLTKENVIQFNEKKDNGNPIDTSLVFPVRGVT